MPKTLILLTVCAIIYYKLLYIFIIKFNIITIMWIFYFNTAKAQASVFAYGVLRPFHTMFVKGVCEIFLKLSNTAANRAFAVAFCVLFRFPLYKYGWFPQMNDQVCQQVLQCLFAMSKMSLQTSV